ncbi:PilX N-terminal domain-containing pilus assembly protein [Rheinheimera sp. 1928-s]|uniref:pilus assembly PilX family protein n=1 Tax=Rheinheimera sp. 1928-s TaxID=3033803 RepID=UPI00260284F4|nr:PilX N-terminal domain-containing pilus assembly protein [Rheinheimera sp. 1928-s]MDF3124462.1 PilX N-terminal domain-containing pilus assembly protein [Rheinheimera sp. 1928-s]
MKPATAQSAYPISQQQGIVLVISLLLLLAITLVAVSSMQSSLLQERMSANLYDRQSSYQQVEAALLEAEVILNVNDPVALIDGAGVYDLPVVGAEDRWNDNGLLWLTATALNGNSDTGAQYLIEYMGDWPYPPECADVASKDKISVGCLSPTFRITARTVSDNGRASVMLQSLFRR